MKLKTVYLALCILGTILAYWQFLPWLRANGLNVRLLIHELFLNRISAFFAIDVIVSSIVLLVFMKTESHRLGIRKRWLAVLALLTVGVSLALPLFLYLRELELEHSASLPTPTTV